MAGNTEQSTDEPRYIFGSFELDVSRALLLQDNVEVKLRRQSYDVLRVLVENAGRLLTKDELHEAVWGQVAVTDDSIAHCISDIRKALGDRDRSMVVTVARRGYRFAAAVTAVGNVAGPRVVTRRVPIWPLVAAATATVALLVWVLLSPPGTAPNSVAVFPFVNATGNRPGGGPVLSESFSNELSLLLGRIDGIRTVPRTSTANVWHKDADVKTKASMLNVAYVVEGQFSLEDEKLNITVELIDGDSGLVVWTDAFAVEGAELNDVQRSIAEHIASIVYPGADISTAIADLPNPSAMQLIFRADALEQQVREKPEVDYDLLQAAIRYYQAATELDPDSALAYSRLASALLYLGDFEAAETAIFKALALNADLAEVQTTYGKYLVGIGSPDAGATIEKAIAIDPDNADALSLYAYWLWLLGNSVGPAEYYQRAIENDEHSLSRFADLGNFLGTQARVSELRELTSEIKARFDSVEAYEVIARMHEFLGEADHAIAWTLMARDRDPDNPAYTWKLAELYATIGDAKTALSLDRGMGTLFFVRDYDAMVETGENLLIEYPGDFMSRYLLAFAYNSTGDYGGAIRQLEELGIPAAYRRVPSAVQLEAAMIYMNALYATGATEKLLPLLLHWQSRGHVSNLDWWSNTMHACNWSMLGDNGKAIEYVVRIQKSTRIPWYPLVMDSPCFVNLERTEEYQALLDRIDAQRRSVLNRLPKTLAEYGVSL